jgi:hypothetical protein
MRILFGALGLVFFVLTVLVPLFVWYLVLVVQWAWTYWLANRIRQEHDRTTTQLGILVRALGFGLGVPLLVLTFMLLAPGLINTSGIGTILLGVLGSVGLLVVVYLVSWRQLKATRAKLNFYTEYQRLFYSSTHVHTRK